MGGHLGRARSGHLQKQVANHRFLLVAVAATVGRRHSPLGSIWSAPDLHPSGQQRPAFSIDQQDLFPINTFTSSRCSRGDHSIATRPARNAHLFAWPPRAGSPRPRSARSPVWDCPARKFQLGLLNYTGAPSPAGQTIGGPGSDRSIKRARWEQLVGSPAPYLSWSRRDHEF